MSHEHGLLFDAALRLVGIVKDGSGTPIVGATVWLFRTSDGAYIGATTSDSNGQYVFIVADSTTQYFVRAHADAYQSQRVFGTTDRTLVGS